MKITTREQWLLECLNRHIRRYFKSAGYDVPEKVRVTCGWPSRKATGKGSHTIGQCWSHKASQDGYNEIFISPRLGSQDGVTIIATLVHEVAHAVVGCEEGHNATFGKCARAVGLDGKLTATVPTAALKDLAATWLKDLGDYPHARINPNKSGVAKQGTRLIKIECSACGCVARVTRKWLDQYEYFPCPCGHKLKEATDAKRHVHR